MEEYYIAILFLVPLAVFVRGWPLIFLITLVGSYFVFTMPSTGLDYFYYKQAYDNAYLTPYFPWFHTNSILTAEPLYIWYTSAISIMTPFSFQGFLVFNFIFCVFLSFLIFRKAVYLRLDLFWLSYLPVVFPTIFYFSPRSSLSFFLVMLGFVLLCHRRLYIALLMLGLGTLLHSQYMLVSAFGVMAYLAYIYTEGLSEKLRRRTGIFLIIFFGCSLFGIKALIGVLATILGALPSANVAVSKLQYFEGGGGGWGFRITSILSILIYPIMYFLILKKKRERGLLFFRDFQADKIFSHMLGLVVLLGAVINVVFVGESHIAGRLSRFSDYVGMGVMIPAFLTMYVRREICVFVLWLMVLVSPLIYGTLYVGEKI